MRTSNYKITEDIEWFQSYLCGRGQCRYRGEASGVNAVACGVPQGPVLRPVLFVFVYYCLLFFYHLFADGTMLYLSGDSIDEIIRFIN